MWLSTSSDPLTTLTLTLFDSCSRNLCFDRNCDWRVLISTTCMTSTSATFKSSSRIKPFMHVLVVQPTLSLGQFKPCYADVGNGLVAELNLLPIPTRLAKPMDAEDPAVQNGLVLVELQVNFLIDSIKNQCWSQGWLRHGCQGLLPSLTRSGGAAILGIWIQNIYNS